MVVSVDEGKRWCWKVDMLFLYLMMKGSVRAGAAGLQAHANSPNQSKIHLSKYDQQYFFWGRCINNILSRPNSFLQQRKCEEQEEWVQREFKLLQARKQIKELVDYYRFYKNSPTLANPTHLDLMGRYWNKKKSLYYRRIKRELHIQDQPQDETADPHVQQIPPSDSLWTGTFQLPSQLNQPPVILQTDPDATIRRLLLTLTAKKQHKSTRQVSKVAQFHQKTPKSHLKSHLKTNASQLVSTCQFKKSKKKQQHKSMSNEHKICQANKSHQKKINPTSSCRKIGLTQPQFTLNYQRRNKPKQPNKESNKKRLSTNKQPPTTHKKQSTAKKGKSAEKSISIVCRSKSGRKSKQVQTSANVKAVIDKVKDKIKAQKSVMLKKYVQSRQSCKSNDSTRGETAKRYLK